MASPITAPHPVLRWLAALPETLERLWRPGPHDEADLAGALDEAEAAQAAGRAEEAAALYRRILQWRRSHLPALRGLRDLALAAERWGEAVELQQRVVAAVPAGERATETETLAAIHYQRGRVELQRGAATAAVLHFRSASRVDRGFVPALIALGDAHEQAGDRREAVRVWERGAQHGPSLPLLRRLERAYHEEGRPTRMIALYRDAIARDPDDLALAVALGRVYLDLEMIDAAADQFEKVEVRAPELAVVHAYLGEVFERRGDTRSAFDEYRRALALGHAFEWPHRCRVCARAVAVWHERCPHCGRWNAVDPVSGPRA